MCNYLQVLFPPLSGICGQMHGIVLWRSPAWTDKFELVNEHISNLVTWQDTRCDHAYLATLPRPDSHLRAYTGYGVNTLLWMTHHEPGILDQYAHAATIQVLPIMSHLA